MQLNYNRHSAPKLGDDIATKDTFLLLVLSQKYLRLGNNNKRLLYSKPLAILIY